MGRLGTATGELTAKQRKIWEYLRDYIAEHGCPPTRETVMDHFGYKTVGPVTMHYAAMKLKGWMVSGSNTGRNRDVRLIDKSSESERERKGE